MLRAYIAVAVRTPREHSNDKESLRDIKLVDLPVQVLDSADICDAAIGCVAQTGDQGAHNAKMAVPRDGSDDAVSAFTMNRFCASGLTAVQFAASQALAFDQLAVGGGVEKSRVCR